MAETNQRIDRCVSNFYFYILTAHKSLIVPAITHQPEFELKKIVCTGHDAYSRDKKWGPADFF